MTQNIQQWLAEIRALQHQVAELRQERDEAYGSAANWRRLYETEARQRRTDVAELKETIAELQRRQAPTPQPSPLSVELSLESGNGELETLIEHLQAHLAPLPPDQRNTLLLKTLTECHQLRQELDKERSAHAQTRQSLMNALGDTVDLLTKERAHRSAD